LKDTIKLIVNALLTGGAMYCIWDLENTALLMGINGTQFMYVIGAMGLLGGVTLAPVVELIKKMNFQDEEEHE